MPSKKKTTRSAPSDNNKLSTPADKPAEREPAEDPTAVIPPSKIKIPEDANNLRQREEWFQKRSGKR